MYLLFTPILTKMGQCIRKGDFEALLDLKDLVYVANKVKSNQKIDSEDYAKMSKIILTHQDILKTGLKFGTGITTGLISGAMTNLVNSRNQKSS